jgi:hypothetical protein
MIDMLAHMNILFDLKLLDILFLYYYYFHALDKCNYYILCIFYTWLASLTSQLNEPSRAELARYQP